MEKTNVMRILDQKKIPYHHYEYDNSQAYSGTEVADMLGQDPKVVYKTLVTVAKSKKNYVFVIPVEEESIEMLKSKELLPLTGYVHGGCSPIGMKKAFTTFLHSTAKEQEHIIFSAGKIGYQVEVAPEDLAKVVRFAFADVIK